MNAFPFRGSIVALITPFHKDFSLDYATFEKLIAWHIQQGSHALVIAGTTGESPTLSVEEHIMLLSKAVDIARGKIPIIGGTGANSTAEAIELAKQAKKAGVAAQLSVVPYYNKPNQEGLYRHFSTIAQTTDLPLILYDVPARTIVRLHPETIARLTVTSNIIGLKDATGDIEHAKKVRQLCPKNFGMLSGDDSTAFEFMHTIDGDGLIGVASNVAPQMYAQLVENCLQKNFSVAFDLENKLKKLVHILGQETNPMTIKAAAHILGIPSQYLRLPLIEANAQSFSALQAELAALHLPRFS